MQAKRSKRRKKSKGPAILLVLLVLLVICIGTAFGLLNYVKGYNKAFDPSSRANVSFEILPGTSTSGIAESLEHAGIIENGDIFKFKSRLMELDGKYQAGKYSLSPSMTMEEIMSVLQDARRETKSFTIPEGYNLYQIGQSLQKQGIVNDAKDFYAALSKDYDYWFLEGVDEYSVGFGDINARANRLEGFLFPDTYEIFADASPDEVIDKMLSQFEKELDAMNFTQSDDFSVFELVIKASLIERETRADSDRAKVASVINNRLEKGMKLQLDASVLYALGEIKDRVTYDDLEVDSPYNTYVVSGLPIGPIACPGRASLNAALNPEDTDFLYYVLKPDGSFEHNFAADYDTFLNYKKQYTNSL